MRTNRHQKREQAKIIHETMFQRIIARLRSAPNRRKRVVFVCLTGDPISWSTGAAIAFTHYLRKNQLFDKFSVYSVGAANTSGVVKRNDIVVSPLFNKEYAKLFPQRVGEIKKLSRKGTHIAAVMKQDGAFDLKKNI